jgi:PAS domain S-box-containing protein
MDSRRDQTGLTVLYVDDNPALLELGKTFLEREDPQLNVDIVEGGAEALERLRTPEYDAVVSDYQMPDVNGLEFLKTVRDDWGDDVPFIIFTGQGREQVAMEALNHGADRYLQKGGDSRSQYGVLAQAIHQEVERRRAKDARRKNENRYRSLFENNPLGLWVEDFSDAKAYMDEIADDVDDFESYLEENPDEMAVLLDALEIIDVNENALDYYGAETKEELVDNVEALFTEEAYEANRSLMAQIAEGETYYRTESVSRTLDGEQKHEILEVNVPEEYADDYSRVYLTVMEITDRVEAKDRKAFLHSLLRHDVRNKEQVVRGYIDQVREYDLPDEATGYLERALETLDESAEIIDKVGALSETDEAQTSEDVAVRSLVESVVGGFESQADERGVELEVCGDDPLATGGPLLEEVFANLVGNVFAHANASHVRVTVRDRDDGALVAVEDDGVGIPDHEKDRIFDRRYTAGSNPGAGLGLHLVSEVVGTYGGSVEVTDSELGGARFDVHLE